MLVAFVVPVGQVLWLSVVTEDGQFTLAHFARLFEDSYYLRLIGRTLRLSLLITLGCLLLGWPLAYITTRIHPRFRLWLLILIVLPLMTSVVIRTFGWVVILGRGGVMASVLQWLELAPRNFGLLFTESGLVISMVQVLLPFMTLPILGVLAKHDPSIEEAARTNGAGFFRSLWHVVIPLSLPGVISGSLLAFALSASSFITPNLIAGVRLPVLASSIYRQATSTLDWHFAAAQAVVLLIIVLAIVFPYLLIIRRQAGNQW